MLEIRGFAKLNLCLSVTGKKERLHTIDSVFVPAPVWDDMTAEKAEDIEILYTDGRVYENDTAKKTARLIREKYHTGGVKIVIRKGIPEGAGLGGSSVCAGLAARGMQELYRLPAIDEKLLLQVGSDVPYFYRGGFARVSGAGEKIESLRLPSLYTVVLVPKSKVDTGKCYALYDEIGGDNGDVDEFIANVRKGILRPFNGLQRAAEKLNPDVTRGLEILQKASFACGMTGSGSAVFGIETDRGRFGNKMKKLAANGFAVYAEKE